jgi:hypothetical protein
VHSQPAGSGEKALEYLSRYVFKTAISSARLLWQDDHRVAFSYRDSATKQERTCVLAADEPELPAGAEMDRKAARRAIAP